MAENHNALYVADGNMVRLANGDEMTLDEFYGDHGEERGGIYNDELGYPCLTTEVIDGVVYTRKTARIEHAIVMGNIARIIWNAFKDKSCSVFADTLEYHYRFDADTQTRERDFLQPDIMICCDKTKLMRHGYYAAPKFVAEVINPETAKRDKDLKFRKYEETGVSEYWIVYPKGSIDIYYLEDGHYDLHTSTMLVLDPLDRDYNADMVIALRDFPDIKMTLGEIFEE